MDLTPLRSLIQDSPLKKLSPTLEDHYLEQIRHGDFPRWRKLLAELPRIDASSMSLGDIVTIGRASDSDPETLAALEQQLREFIPWRKGPFNLFGIAIDSEWRSNLKWERLLNGISPLAGRKILDVGSGNGYYGFRMNEAGAELVIGIDPHIAYLAQFWAVKHFASSVPVFVLPLALEQMPGPLRCFDTVFSMGVIYHRRSPIDHLQQLKSCLRPGGELVLETLYVDGEEGYSLTPKDSYARMSNVWFVPSIKTITSWLLRCGFVNIELIDESTTTIGEQRKTSWMPYDSLEDALDAGNTQLTIEGLPAPKRAVLVARLPD